MTRGDFSAVVARHWRDTTGYVVTGSEPCIRIGAEEVRRIRRRLVAVTLDEAARLQLEGSWFMGVVVCPGDDLGALAGWGTRVEAARVHFYLHAAADPRQLAPWRDAGLPLDRVELGIRSWGSLHKLLGWDLNVLVYEDHRPA